MENRKESRLAWKTWTILDQFSSILWNVYEKEFLQFCQNDYIPDAEDNDGDEDNSILGTESEFIAAQNKKRKV
jgi:hypothetical protein